MCASLARLQKEAASTSFSLSRQFFFHPAALKFHIGHCVKVNDNLAKRFFTFLQLLSFFAHKNNKSQSLEKHHFTVHHHIRCKLNHSSTCYLCHFHSQSDTCALLQDIWIILLSTISTKSEDQEAKGVLQSCCPCVNLSDIILF